MSEQNNDSITREEIKAELTLVLKKFESQVKALHEKELAKNAIEGYGGDSMAMKEPVAKADDCPSCGKKEGLAKMGMTHALRVAGVSQNPNQPAKPAPAPAKPAPTPAGGAPKLPGMTPVAGKGVPDVGVLASQAMAGAKGNATSTGGRPVAFARKPGADEQIAHTKIQNDSKLAATNLAADKKAAGVGFLSNLISKFHGAGKSTWSDLSAPSTGAALPGRAAGRMAAGAAAMLRRTEMEKAGMKETSVSQANKEMKGFQSLASSPTAMPKMPGLPKPASFPAAPKAFGKAAMPASGKPAMPKAPGAAAPKTAAIAPAKPTLKGEMAPPTEGLMTTNHNRSLVS